MRSSGSTVRGRSVVAALALLVAVVPLAACREDDQTSAQHDDAKASQHDAAKVGAPQFSKPVFNDPLGTDAKQRAIFDQLIGLVQGTPRGERINLVMHQFDIQPSGVEQQVVNALTDAGRRGVTVKVLLDSRNGDKGQDRAYRALAHGLNGDSGVSLCGNHIGAERGCIAKVRNHNKFATFSKVVVGGRAHTDVLFQSSANLTDWYLNQSYNDSYTVDGDQRLYNSYVRYTQDLYKGSEMELPANPGLYWNARDYFWSASGSSPGFRAYFYPRIKSGDVIDDELRKVKCQYQEGGEKKVSLIRIAMLSFTSDHWDLAQDLADLAESGCWVGMIFDSGKNPNNHNKPSVDPKIQGLLGSSGVDMVPCNFQNPKYKGKTPVVPHTKDVAIDGSVGGKHVKEVYTGSANLADPSASDDVTLKIAGSHPHDDYYVGWMNDVRDGCIKHRPMS